MRVLYRYPIYKTSIVFSIILFITLVAIVISAISLTLFYYKKCELYVMVMAFLFAGCCICLLGFSHREVPTSKYRYEVLIFDDEYLAATTGRYKVVDKKAPIYILEDK